MNRTKLILNHFYSADDLIHGIEVLHRYHVPIVEVYLSIPIKGIEEKLQIKQLRWGYAAVRFGFLGGTALATLIYYLAEQGWPSMSSRSIIPFVISVIVMALTFFFATCLFPSQTPKLLNLPRAYGQTFLIVIDAHRFTDHVEVRQLFQYAEAVEMSPLVKDIVTT